MIVITTVIGIGAVISWHCQKTGGLSKSQVHSIGFSSPPPLFPFLSSRGAILAWTSYSPLRELTDWFGKESPPAFPVPVLTGEERERGGGGRGGRKL